MLNAAAIIAANLYPQPLWFPQAFDASGEYVRMFRFDEPDYRAAPFLDQRGIREGMPYGVVPYAMLARRTPPAARRDAHWIFHISHVGSTLISRLLGETGSILALREPGVLRALVRFDQGRRSARLPVLRALLSRVFDPLQRAMIKATSNVSEIAVPLVGEDGEGGKAAMIGMAPERFIAARLAGNREGIHQRAPERMARLARRYPGLDPIAASIDDARLAAMAWATESCAIETAMQAIGQARAQFVDVDVFLADPMAGLKQLTGHFDIAASHEQLSAIIDGPLMKRHSKANDLAFDAAKRETKIAAQLMESRQEISAARAWLDTTAVALPLLGAALDRY